jgi:hypothetical protein
MLLSAQITKITAQFLPGIPNSPCNPADALRIWL